MFTQHQAQSDKRISVRAASCTFGRNLSATVQKLSFRKSEQVEEQHSECADGVCSLNWKPQRPAA